MTFLGLTKQTLAIIAGTIAIMATVISGTMAITGAINEMRSDLAANSTRIGQLEDSQYSTAAAAEQALRMAIANPGLRVPDPRDPSQLIQVVAATKDMQP